MWGGPSQPHIPGAERELGSWSLPDPSLCLTIFRKSCWFGLTMLSLAMVHHGTTRHSPASSSQSFWPWGSLLFPQLLASSYSIKKMLLKHNHLMAFLQCINHFPVDTWQKGTSREQVSFSSGFRRIVSVVAGKHGRSSSVGGRSVWWRLPHITVNKQAEEGTRPSKAWPQWPTSAIQASPPQLYSLQNSATSWGLCANPPSCRETFPFQTMTTGNAV